ncbi:BTB/POZ and MATH domain-containing protein 3 [Carex littledalei]|uniref:BTB/POZ and MATH domain-containing protein 3 n=1 Tax=Carex littledalei TaxID=544730 RepID=A0A833R8U8_9POAL|nr:BTB/POZ and MATH domain-containing protein 3 [Carex littledalei]
MSYADSSKMVSICQIETFSIVHLVKVNGYSMAKEFSGISIEAGKFDLAGHTWAVLCKPSKSEHKNYPHDNSWVKCIAFSLVLVTEPEVPMVVSCELSLLNQDGKPSPAATKSFQASFTEKRSVGFSKFMEIAELEASGLLKNDSLMIQCSLQNNFISGLLINETRNMSSTNVNSICVSNQTREKDREMRKHLLILCITIALAGAINGSSFDLSDITVQGVIYCRCNLTGYAARVDASPLSGIVASLKCSISNYHTQVNSTTDSSGYFQVSTKMVKKYVGHYCTVYVLSSPLSQCYVSSELKFAGTGSRLIFEKDTPETGPMYSAGLVLIGPATSASCHA